jgi:hypothetical protein
MSQSTFITANGACVFWRCARWSHRQSLFEGLSLLGLERFCPGKRTNLACLNDALCAAFPGAGFVVQRLESKDSYEVVRIQRGEERNTYVQLGKFTISEDGGGRHITMTPYDQATVQAVLQQFNKFLGYVRGEQVTDCLVQIIYQWKGTCLKPGGGMYWVADEYLAQWQGLSEVVSRASMSNTGRLYQMLVAKDEDTLRAVIDALTEEIDGEVAGIDRDIRSDELGSRALENRRAAASRLAHKVEQYERMFSTPLPKLRDNLSRVELAAARAAMMASVAKVEA